MNKVFKYLGIGIACLLVSGCIGKFEEYNTNPYQPSVVAPTDLLATMFNVYASPQQNDCQFNNCMWAGFSGHVAAPAQWRFGDNNFAYYAAVNAFNDSSWGIYYGKIYPNFYRIADATKRTGVIYSIASITRIYAMHIMLSLQGPIPYTKMVAGNTKAEYDSEEVAWKALFADLDRAIFELEANKDQKNSDLVQVDQFYRGDLSKWLKFANTLKLRMAIRVSNVLPDARKYAEEAVADGVMESTEDSSYDTTSSGIQKNGYSIVDSWGEVKANANLISYMNGYNDPRREKYFTTQTYGYSVPVQYLGVRFGSSKTPSPAEYANYSRLAIAANDRAAQPVMYAAEAAFLRAEGALKGWNMGASAKELYEQGIRLSFQEFGVEGVESYLRNSSDKPAEHRDYKNAGNDFQPLSNITIKWDESASAAQKLERVLVQKWIALYLDPLNGWSDFRRTGYPKLAMAVRVAGNSPASIVRGQRRLRFAESEYNNNKENVTTAISLLGGNDDVAQDLWWAKKN